MMTQEPKAQTRLLYIDSLRGIAALYVLVFHVAVSPLAGQEYPSTLHRIFSYGGSGVTLFFVMSAFSLCLTMPNHVRTGYPLLSFGMSRFFRIAPLFYVVLLFSLARATGWFDRPAPVGHVLTSITFTFNLFPAFVVSPVWGGWTIGVEMVFYAIFPLIFFRLPSIRGKLVLAGVAVFAHELLGLFGDAFIDEKYREQFERRNIVAHLPSFVVGMVAFDLFVRWKNTGNTEFIGRISLCSGLALLIWLIFVSVRPPFISRELADALAYASILLGASLVTPRVLENGILAFYGRLSFSVYLWHIVVIWALADVLQVIFRLDLPIDVRFGACLILVLALTTVVAQISYTFVENPGVRLGRSVFRRMTVRTTSRARAAN